MRDRLVGTVLDGRYLVGNLLGGGGMGSVYRGTQISVGREVAIKVVSPQWVRNRDVIRRFVREATLTSQLLHPNAVSVLDFGQTQGGIYYLVMELLSGRSLEEVLRVEGRLSPERVVRIGTQICSALLAAHHLSILHRDLKPANIIVLDGLSTSEHVKVVDFGIAKSLSLGTGRGNTDITRVGALLGTPAYMAPEVLFGAASDHRSDLYSLGAIMYQLATGRTPYLADTIPALIAQMCGDETPPTPHELGVPTQLASVITGLIARNPDHRYPDASHVLAALAQLEYPAHSSVTPLPAAYDIPPPPVGPRPRARRAWPIALALLALCGAALISVLLSQPTSSAPPQDTSSARSMR